MQTLTEIRQLLDAAGFSPQKQFGQNFLIDKNLMAKLLELAEITGEQTVLEVGPGTGSLTEELCERAGRVAAVEIDRGLCELLRSRFSGRANFRLVCGDVLAGKRHISPEVLDAVRPAAWLVSNLPYNISTPLLMQCLVDSWTASKGAGGDACLFHRLTFTVQREVAERLAAGAGGGEYGPVSVLVALLGRITPGPVIPATAFWPRPNVESRILRIDFDAAAAGRVADAAVLTSVLSLAFGQRRKQIGSILKRKDAPFPSERLADALGVAGIARTLRAEQVPPPQYLKLANALCRS